jgi:CheY-like chemotaxis protein
LSISKRLAEMLGGDISILNSEVGLGTCFRVSVETGPLDGVAMIDDPTDVTMLAAEKPKEANLSSDALDCRVLLAEDGPDNQRLIAHVLRKAGAEVTIVENGKLALDNALDAHEQGIAFDVILMDMQMPVMDGYEATALLRQKGYSGPIIALTAHAMTGDREKCIRAGCDDFATKPIDRKRLIATIRSILQRSGLAADNLRPVAMTD